MSVFCVAEGSVNSRKQHHRIKQVSFQHCAHKGSVVLVIPIRKDPERRQRT